MFYFLISERMWLVWFKILYDSSPVVRVLFWLIVLYLIAATAWSLYGWIGIGILIIIIAIMVLSIWYEIRKQ